MRVDDIFFFFNVYKPAETICTASSEPILSILALPSIAKAQIKIQILILPRLFVTLFFTNVFRKEKCKNNVNNVNTSSVPDVQIKRKS